jgi:hypothetical protein
MNADRSVIILQDAMVTRYTVGECLANTTESCFLGPDHVALQREQVDRDAVTRPGPGP